MHERMKSGPAVSSERDIKRVGKSGQISLGKQRLADGVILLVPVVVVPRSHWSVRDESKIRKALDWAAKHPPAESDVDALTSTAATRAAGKKRGR